MFFNPYVWLARLPLRLSDRAIEGNEGNEGNGPGGPFYRRGPGGPFYGRGPGGPFYGNGPGGPFDDAARHGRRITFAVGIALLLGCGWTSVAFAADPVQFNRDVRPILSENCLTCHGPDKNKREADLRLDDPVNAVADRDGKRAIVPGKPDESELIQRLITADADLRMPPDSTGKKLTPKQIETLRTWIAEGAKYERHWSLIPPVRPAPPIVKEANWARNDIDRFILAKLEQQGVAPSKDADKRMLIRRASFDLTGLPPTPAEVEAFLDDSSPDAFEKVVDRLLASDHYGERMAQYWLDVVRYADSAGYHSDNDRSVWPYRDYVIQSFNKNKPFDQFTIEQLAGDLLPNATNEQKIASGYNRLLQTTEEGGAQPKEYSAKYQADRVRNTSVIWMAMTMGCCECHSHKYDPFTIKDFYSLAAFFADVQEKPVGRQDQTPVPSAEQLAQLAELERKQQEAKGRMAQQTPEWAAAQVAWEKQLLDRLTQASQWAPLRPEKVESAGGTEFVVQDDLSVLASGNNPDQDTYTVTLKPSGEKVTAIRLDTLTHPSLTNQSLSRANGNFVLTELEVEWQPAEKPAIKLKLKTPAADFEQSGHAIALAIDGKPETGWAVNGHVTAADHRAMFVLDKPLTVLPGGVLTIRLKHQSPFPKHNIGRFRLALTASDAPSLDGIGNVPGDVVNGIKLAADKRSDAQRDAIRQYFRQVAPELAPLRDEIAKLDKQQTDLKNQFPQSLITVSVAPRPVRILARGNWLDDSGELVDPNVPESLGTLARKEGRATRLDFAQWMTAKENPLTARVFVNRLWKLCFGHGIVKTLDDFGAQGDWPSHPELLDWLATEFQQGGWNVKQIMKQMLMSRTYQQTSVARKDLREHDPGNRWFARQDSFRLEAEMVRDNALAVSGLLVRKLGGPSVKPYQPAGYWQYLNFPKREWQNDSGDSQYRRGLYTHWQRTFLHPSMAAFDASTREESCCDRPRSNTPLQALALLNDPSYVEAARVLAARAINDGGTSDEQRLRYVFQQVLQRAPAEPEAKMLGELVRKHREQFASDPGSAAELLKVGQAPAPSGMNPVELAAWTSVTRVVLNLHETITRY